MEKRFTPGPWMVNPLHTRSPYGIIAQGGGADLAKVYVTDPDTRKRTPEYEGNLRLIAAAPELLEALERIVKELGASGYKGDTEEPSCIRTARAAIAKAKGGDHA